MQVEQEKCAHLEADLNECRLTDHDQRQELHDQQQELEVIEVALRQCLFPSRPSFPLPHVRPPIRCSCLRGRLGRRHETQGGALGMLGARCVGTNPLLGT